MAILASAAGCATASPACAAMAHRSRASSIWTTHCVLPPLSATLPWLPPPATRGACACSSPKTFPPPSGRWPPGASHPAALPPDEQERLDLGPDAHGTPTATNPRGLLVIALAASGHVAEAIAMGEATREGMPRHTPLGELGWAHYGDRYAGLGTAYALAGRLDEARDAFVRAQDIYRALGHHSTLAAVTSRELRDVLLPYRTEQLDEHWGLAAATAGAWERGRAQSARATSTSCGCRSSH